MQLHALVTCLDIAAVKARGVYCDVPLAVAPRQLITHSQARVFGCAFDSALADHAKL